METVLCQDLCDVFLIISWVMGFWEEDYRGEVCFSSCCMKGHPIILFIAVDVDLDHLSEVVLPVFSTVKSL